jgi:hypothetical protein
MQDSDDRPISTAAVSRRRWRTAGIVIGIGLIVVAVAVVIVVRGVAHHRPLTAQTGGSGSMSSSPSVDASAGRPGMPTGPAPSPARTTLGIDATAFVADLRGRWGLVFEDQPFGTGSRHVGLAGDPTRAQRRLDGEVSVDGAGLARGALCMAGGTQIKIVGDDTVVPFLYDCVQHAVPVSAWAAAKSWLDAHIAWIRTGGFVERGTDQVRLTIMGDGHSTRITVGP